MDLKNSYIEFLTLQKVGHKVREEKSILATETTPIDERKEEDLIPFLLSPFRKKLELKHFQHLTNKLEFNKVYNLCTSAFQEEIDFVDFSNEILKQLFEKSLHPQIKSGEVFIVQFNNVLFDEISCRAIGIYKLENKSKFIRFDERNTIDYDVLKGYKLDKIDKACLILDVYKEDGYRIYSIDDQHQESEFWTKNFLDIKPVINPTYQTKKFLEAVQDFSEIVLEKTDKKEQNNFINKAIGSVLESEEMNPELSSVIFAEYKDDFNEFLKENEVSTDFEINTSAALSFAKKIKSSIKLDTGSIINLDILNNSSIDELERGYDEERKMYYYKIYFNTEI